MAASRTRTVLVAGLGKFVGAHPTAAAQFGPEQSNRKLAADSLSQAQQAGFDCSSIDVNPEDPEASLKELRKQLTAKSYDAFVIGYGLRGNKDFTPLFERIVNLVVEVNSKTKFAFSTAPDAVFDAILRVLPLEDEEAVEEKRKFWRRSR